MSSCPVSHDFDPFGRAFQADPADALRAAGSVFYSTVMGWYVVTGYENIRAISKDTESFSSKIFSEPMTPLCEQARARLAQHGYTGSTSLGSLDPPLHTARRRLMHEPYKPVNVASWEARVRVIHTDYIARFSDRGRADLVADYFWEAPAVVALEFMGIPEEEVTQVKRFAAGVMQFIFGRPDEDEQVAACELIGQHYQYARRLVERLCEHSDGDGLLQRAVYAHREHPDVIDEEFLVSLGISTLSAAHETTSASLANAMVLLLTDRSRWEALCRDPELIPNAVEECLRCGPSLTTNRRLCIKDTVVGGVPIPAGARVLLGVAAANQDPEVFSDPDVFDIERETAKRHLTFGFGAHTCLGAPLARLQMRVALDELTRRMPDMRLVPDQILEYAPNASARAPRSVEVEWSLP